jgi:hypothetical protein
MDKPRSRLTDTGELPAGQSSGGRRQMLGKLLLDADPMMSYGQTKQRRKRWQ